MIPEEVAHIATILRDSYDNGMKSTEEFNYSVKVAYEIYNALRINEQDNNTL